jgi:hypothetical protein
VSLDPDRHAHADQEDRRIVDEGSADNAWRGTEAIEHAGRHADQPGGVGIAWIIQRHLAGHHVVDRKASGEAVKGQSAARQCERRRRQHDGQCELADDQGVTQPAV